jgi:hypothetical protein
MRTTSKEMREVEIVTLTCDLCGSKDMSRYECNRKCQICGREVCGKCQSDFEHETRCKVCQDLAGEWIPKINAAYEQYEALQQQWKEASLMREATHTK